MPFHFAEFESLTAHPGKSCGGCTACCMVVPVEQIGLAAFTRCPKLRPPFETQPGCSIYATRPSSCREWSCTWLISDLPDEMRPDRCGVVIDPIADVIHANGVEMPAAQLWALPGREEAWRTDPVSRAIVALCNQGLAVLWRQRGPDGEQLARAFRKDGEGVGYSELTPAGKGEEVLGSDRDRFRRAQQMIQDAEGR